MKKSSMFARRRNWPKTKGLLESLTSESLEKAAKQMKNYEPMTDPAVRELLRMITLMGSTVSGSDEKKSHLLTEIKSLIVYYGLPLIYLTLNPGDRHSPVTLLYAGEEIDIKSFCPSLWTSATRLRLTLSNPLAVVEYFHTTINVIIGTMLMGGMFGELTCYYGPIEYQGRGTPHTHLAVFFVFYLS